MKESAAGKHRVAFERNRQFVRDHLSSNPCVDCGVTDPRVLEFDHVSGEKRLAISHMITGYSLDSIKREIEKCEVRCANCHRIKTHKQLNWWGRTF